VPDRPLRLLDVSIIWPPEFQPFIAGRLRALATAGVEIMVGTSNHGPVDPKLLPFARIIRLPSARESGVAVGLRTLRTSLIALFRNPKRFARLVGIGWTQGRSPREFAHWWCNAAPYLSANPDVIHFEWNGAATTFNWLPDLFGVPFVVSCRGRQVNILPYVPGNEHKRHELAESFSRAALVHGVCHNILGEAEKLGMPRDKGRVVYTAVDSEFFHPQNRVDRQTDEPVRLLNVGAAIWRKGYEYLLLALQQVVDLGYNVELSLVDFDGPERERAKHTVAELGLEGRVHVLGKLNATGVRDALWQSDVLVLSALSEGVSNAVVEAMACGIPVITTDCGGMREAVTDGVEGLVVPTRDPFALADAIIRLARDPRLRVEMGRAGRARVDRDFQPAMQAQRFIALYEEVLHSQPDPGTSVYFQASVQNGQMGVASQPMSRIGDPSSRARQPLEIVTVADLDWRNGHEYALDAVRDLTDRDFAVHYTIVGNGTFLEAVGFARHEMGLTDVVDVILDPSRGREALQTADVFLLAAVSDGANHALQDALQAGIPCICTDAPVLESLSKDRHQCRIVPRRDKCAIAEAILQVRERIQSDVAVSRARA